MQMEGIGNFNGKLLFEYIENLVSQINNGALPELSDTFTYLSGAKSLQAKEDAFQVFQDELKQIPQMPCDDETLETF